MVGRKRIELTPEIEERIIRAVQIGTAYKHAASYAGISYKTLFRWIQMGKNSKSRKTQIYRDLMQKIENAHSKFVISLLMKLDGVVKNVTNKNWQAVAWMLERSHPELYGRNRQVEDCKGNKNNDETQQEEDTKFPH